ncbi:MULTISPECIES: hypothetical protein [unclassified Fictibacillus]|nr:MULTISPECIES: hypothetical protein [unclassified Fictibacillus]
MRHLKVKLTNVAHRLPRGKRAPVMEINTYKSNIEKRTAFYL